MGYNKQEIKKELDSFMHKNYPRYNPVDWFAMIESVAEKADKYTLCECDGVTITENEINIIKSVEDKVLERLLFTLLCMAKFLNFRNENNNDWVNFDDSEIFKIANISISAFNKGIKLNTLRELGLIEYAKRIDNLNIRVLYIDKSDDATNILLVDDFRSLGNEWRLYCGENYIRCNECGKLIRKTSKNKKYCTDCINENPYYQPFSTKIIKCIDCRKEVEVNGNVKNKKRCDDCQKVYDAQRNRIRVQKYRNKNK